MTLVKNKMILARLTKILVWFVFSTSIVLAQDKIIVKHYQTQSRYDFGISLLDLALSKLDQNYEILTPYKDHELGINEARGEVEIIAGELDLEFMSTTARRQSLMIPVKIPVYRGLLGLRLLLIKPEMIPEMNNVKSLEALRPFIAGHGAHWGDLPVYEANDLKVMTNVHYEHLFKMLIAGRFHYFHRGVNEIWSELERYSEELLIADHIMLFYPHPVYFFIGKHRPELALQIEKGLKIAIEDGSYRKLFFEYFKNAINKAQLDKRTLIILDNPVIPKNTPSIDTSWWLPKQVDQIN